VLEVYNKCMACSAANEGDERENIFICAVKLHTAGSIGNCPNFHITEKHVAYCGNALYSLFVIRYSGYGSTG
jgi:hypothetical protein